MRRSILILLTLASTACISPSVVGVEDRAPRLSAADFDWADATEEDVPGTYVSIEITGQLASVLRKVVYQFEEGGTYTGAGLVEDVPVHFEVITGTWRLNGADLVLDDAPPAHLQVADDGALRFSGDAGAVTLRRELTL